MPSAHLSARLYLAVDVVILLTVWPVFVVILLCMMLMVGLYEGLLPFQIFLSERKRRWTVGTNDGNLSARLPPEIQLRIFRILAARLEFGHDERGHRFLGPPGPPSVSSLRSCTLVCPAWTACATEVLYTDVSLCLIKHCLQFANTLERRPELALLVRRLELPGETRGLPELTPEHMMKPVYHPKRIRKPGARLVLWGDLAAAVDRVLARCVNVNDVVFHGAGNLQAFPGLSQCLPRLRQLALCSPNVYTNLNAPNAPWHAKTLTFPSPTMHVQFSRLESLSLYRHLLFAPDVETGFPEDFEFSALHILELVWCELDEPWLAFMLARAPRLRILRWRQSFITHQPQFTSLPLLQLVRPPVQGQLVELSVRQFGRLAADDLSPFLSLTTLVLTPSLLYSVTYMPPNLRTLVVRDVRGAYPRVLQNGANRILWSDVARIKHSFSSWVDQAPRLELLELWDVANRRGIALWKLIAFLLRAYLSEFGVSLDVNLTLHYETESYYRGLFDNQEMVRRFLWRDVL